MRTKNTKCEIIVVPQLATFKYTFLGIVVHIVLALILTYGL